MSTYSGLAPVWHIVVLNVKALVATFNQEKALVYSLKLRECLFPALLAVLAGLGQVKVI